MGEWESYKARWSKRYLSDVRSMRHTVDMIRSEIAELSELLDGISGIDYAADRSAGGDGDGLAGKLDRAEALRSELLAELDGYLVARERAHRALANVGQPMRAVLTFRYLEGAPWKEVIARLDAMGQYYSPDYVRRALHERALIELYPYIPHEFDDADASALD